MQQWENVKLIEKVLDYEIGYITMNLFRLKVFFRTNANNFNYFSPALPAAHFFSYTNKSNVFPSNLNFTLYFFFITNVSMPTCYPNMVNSELVSILPL